jgi:hypothetical protein
VACGRKKEADCGREKSGGKKCHQNLKVVKKVIPHSESGGKKLHHIFTTQNPQNFFQKKWWQKVPPQSQSGSKK